VAEFADKVLTCISCGAEFEFSAGEQLFYQDNAFVNVPKRCKACRAARKSQPLRVRPETQIVCSMCGAEATVPFRPTQGKPVLCGLCFRRGKSSPSAS
jgi:CxxC-x17-CxxC domain-containing protein